MAQGRQKSLSAWTWDCLRSHLGNGAVSRDQQSFDVVKGWSIALAQNGMIMARFRAWKHSSYPSTMLQWELGYFLHMFWVFVHECNGLRQHSELFYCLSHRWGAQEMFIATFWSFWGDLLGKAFVCTVLSIPHSDITGVLIPLDVFFERRPTAQ